MRSHGVLNNYATKPKVYYAEYPAIWEQRKYVLQGVLATLLVTALVVAAFAAS
ncbi:photosystem II assembly protein Psb34 [Iningainema tapete]|uniref:photosystem II assembly protein Psb34 n=1 Tax=Iningainema tapete TaxID=2806730 RepID=UPI0030809A3B